LYFKKGLNGKDCVNNNFSRATKSCKKLDKYMSLNKKKKQATYFSPVGVFTYPPPPPHLPQVRKAKLFPITQEDEKLIERKGRHCLNLC